MNIVMFTNTYNPHVGGVARSVDGLARGLRTIGHQVLVVAPTFPDAKESTDEIVRMSALQDFTGSDFALPSPLSRSLTTRLDDFAPDIVHSHHPFLLGGTALRISASRNLPIIYTNHTRYDLYSHYIIQHSEIMKRLALSLTTGYCDLCDAVIAPSKSTADFLLKQNVESPITVIPTGVNTLPLGNVDTAHERKELGIPDEAFLVGHVGRLAQEKNLTYLANALVLFLKSNESAHALIVGGGIMAEPMAKIFARGNVSGRVHMTGVLTGSRLSNAYAVMDAFAFSSVSETQGLVLIEAMSAGVPVVALDAAGARDVIEQNENGFLLPEDTSPNMFAATLTRTANLNAISTQKMRENAYLTAKSYSQEKTVRRTVDLYSTTIDQITKSQPRETGLWKNAKRNLAEQWNILGNVANAVGDAFLPLEANDD
jgi:glycosyltransferase involved in cell wall biosynthesis